MFSQTKNHQSETLMNMQTDEMGNHKLIHTTAEEIEATMREGGMTKPKVLLFEKNPIIPMGGGTHVRGVGGGDETNETTYGPPL